MATDQVLAVAANAPGPVALFDAAGHELRCSPDTTRVPVATFSAVGNPFYVAVAVPSAITRLDFDDHPYSGLKGNLADLNITFPAGAIDPDPAHVSSLGMAVDVESFRPRLAAVTGGLSGPAIRPVAVRCVYQVARALPGVPIIGIRGISEPEHALEFLVAGAWAVQVGTANFTNPDATIEIAEGIRSFLKRKGLSSVAELRENLRLPDRVAEPAYRSG